ncbi:hypothetical protein FPZ43_11560 [Mucilaginibacter pallidiroseus]|uniref:P22 tailspike C-terminal domain-containing protein n=1 Tax=Mucilaginibacter pallidiroseus TaxID=2599295 RepID=A0A563UC05_9SPHI|nr:tail spike protein [Mucilaginibacter pallidiroseus]TWR28897.1 hypothetical protein FPZ43_11560 [Mucilaginibacter pallidiroseus]
MRIQQLFILLLWFALTSNLATTGPVPKGYTSVADFGATGNGKDATKAIQAATNSGKAIYFPPGKYLVSKPISHLGKVIWKGAGRQSIIYGDGIILNVIKGTNSVIASLHFQNITAPIIIGRSTGNLRKIILHKKANTGGYQPTVNDTDIWNSLTEKEKKQDVGPKISFSGKATGILVDHITGNFVSIFINDASYSTISFCDIIGGKNSVGAIAFSNLNGQDGIGNVAKNNKVKYASFNGIVFLANHDGYIQNNVTEHCGESGVKLYQGDIGGLNARNYKIHILNNVSRYNFYDGFDLTTDNPRTGTRNTGHTIKGNLSEYNKQTGFYLDGRGNLFSGNKAQYNAGSGIAAFVFGNKIQQNIFYNNNLNNTPTGVHEMVIDGDSNFLTSNTITRDKPLNGYAIYATGSNTISNNSAKGTTFFFGVEGAVKAILSQNTNL